MPPNLQRDVAILSSRNTVQRGMKPRSRPPKHCPQRPSTPNIVTPHKVLPPEVLIQVFEHAVEADIATNSHLIRITHVCRYFRDLAIHSPALWTDIALRHPDAFKAFLARSKGLPLRISVDMNTTFSSAITKDKLTQTLQALLAESRRTVNLKIASLPPFDFDWVMKGIASAAPQLETLAIERRLPVFVVIPQARPTVVDGMSKLRSLKISGSALYWLPRAPNVLTEIEFNNTLCDVHTMLSLLQCCSASLERLTIRGAFNTPPARDTRRITLARLKALQIHSVSLRGLAALLPSLVLPSEHTTVSFSSPRHCHSAASFGYLGPQANAGPGTFTDLAYALRAPGPLPIAALRQLKRVELRWNRHRLQTLRAYLNSDVEDPAAPALQLQAYASPTSPNARFIGNWPLNATDVETLDIYGAAADLPFLWHSPWGAPWGPMLAAVPRLRTLRIRAVREELLEAILCALATKFRVGHGSDVCPQLKTLILAELTLGEKSWSVLVQLVYTHRTYLETIVVELPKIDPAVCDGWAAIQIRRAESCTGIRLVFTEPNSPPGP